MAVQVCVRVSPGTHVVQPPPAAPVPPPQVVEQFVVSAAVLVFCQVVEARVSVLPQVCVDTALHTCFCDAEPHWPAGQLTVVVRVAPTVQLQPVGGAHWQLLLHDTVAVCVWVGQVPAEPEEPTALQGMVCTFPDGQTP